MVAMPQPSYSKQTEEAAAPASKADVEELMQELRAQKEALAQKEKDLDEQKKLLDSKVSELDETLKQADELLNRYSDVEPPPKPSQKPYYDNGEKEILGTIGERQSVIRLSNMSGRGPEEVGVERKSEKQKTPDVPSVAVDTGGVLLGRGKAVLEPTLKYSRTSALRVAIEGFTVIPAINVGLFDISEIDRDVFTAAVTGRVGVTDRLELETYVPYLWRDDQTIGRPVGVGTATDVLSSVDGSGIGDVEFAAHYQINDGNDGWPYFIGNLRYKTTTGEGPFDVDTDPGTGLQTETPTGSGFHAVQPSVTMLFPSDPAIFYGNLGYTYNMPDDVGGLGEVDPGDSINAGLGMGFSINDSTSFSLGYSHSVVSETELDGQRFGNSSKLQVGATSFGYSYQMNDNVGLNFNMTFGVTDDAPDMQATVRMPIKFDLF